MTELDTTKHFFDTQAESWDDQTTKQKEHRLYTIFRDQIPALKAPLLDLGSGTGILVPILSRTVDMSDHIVELDISKEMIRQSWIKHRSKDYISFIQSDGHILPFRTRSFASVVCFAVFPHFHDQIKAIKEMYRILKKDGLLIILHLMGHRQLNNMHQDAGQAVCHHALQSLDIVSKQIADQSFNIINSCEQENLYLIVAQKCINEK